ncbi:unnamed protein product [Hyaloperonospora brassicae]|uniref:pectin lyase n=1 Tax=Hyaloperonospora brassicae TaxID=162125 RepID=A0AAV0TJM3_HYABA|nr:unnamed protein product [Hyaloperonospora brassicae]
MTRFQRKYAFAAALAFAAKNAAGAFTIGAPSGLGAGTTGGAGGEVVYPTSNAELIEYMNHTLPFIIVLNRTFDFRGTEGTTTEIGCRPIGTRLCMEQNNGFKGQDVILQKGGMNNTGGCTNGTEVMVTYDNAGIQRVLVRDNKTIRGIGKNGVLIGKGLSLRNNIIVQNIHITELNPHLVWGGDAIFVPGSDQGKTVGTNVWLDHVKVSRIGRQMVVTSSAGVSGMTISNSEFDGNTDFSMSCDGHHTWTSLFYGKNTAVTMVNNYVHGTSGRTPKVGGEKGDNVVVHMVNNYWSNNTGHSIDVGLNGHILAEGNYFENTNLTLRIGKQEGALYAFNHTVGSDLCPSYLGRPCAENVLVKSSNLTSRNETVALEVMKTYPNIVDYMSKMARSTSLEMPHGKKSISKTDDTFCGMNLPPVHGRDLANIWAQTTENFGVGKLD